MKKTINVLLIMLLVFSLTACGKAAGDRVANDTQNDTQHQPQNTMDVAKTEGELITRELAIEIALNKAGLTRDIVVGLEAELDREIAGKLWEVDFETREFDYSYDIDAKTGEIILSEVTPEDKDDSPVQQTEKPIQNGETKAPIEDEVPPSEEAVTQPSKEPVMPTVKEEQKVETELITRDKAIEIALKKAGLAKNEIYELEAELDKERNVKVWEVDFETREYEYSYDIDAATGKIILSEIEPEDDRDNKYVKKTAAPVVNDTVVSPREEVVTQPSKKPVTPPVKEEQRIDTEFITRDKAIEIAIKKAGLAKTEVYDLDAELDKERNKKVWEIDFETKEYEYSYEINAQTGDVIHQEKERND